MESKYSIMARLSDKLLKKKVYIISYPRSGRHWTRFLLGHYIALKFNKPFEWKRLVGWGYKFISWGGVMEYPQTKYVPYQEMKKDFRVPRAKKIFLMRDPRDILISYWRCGLRRDRPISELARDETYGIAKIVEFYNLWKPYCKNALIIRYENLPKDAKKILEYMGIKVDEALWEKAVEMANFDKMKKVCNKEVVRRGVIGSHKDEMDMDTRQYVESYIKKHLDWPSI